MSKPKSLRDEPTRPDGYVVIGVYAVGSDRASLLCAPNGKVVVFDTVAIAQQVLPLFGMGRSYRWSHEGERINFTPLVLEGFNRCDILTGYDPYNLPAGMPDRVRSETKGKGWKFHIHWSHVYTDCGQMVRKPDGTVVNTAL